ncbi:MAG TPA: hypothetical protein PLD18_07830, partial [Flavobacterium sp.]|nr:hypothetical protein [Flavobacterium sp.]
TTFEKNFEAFKNNPNFRKQVLDSANETVKNNFGEIVDGEMSNYIYDAGLKQIYLQQKQNFLF